MLYYHGQNDVADPHVFGHGFQTLEDGTEVFYQMSEFYAPELARGLRYDAPKLGITWLPCRRFDLGKRPKLGTVTMTLSDCLN
jgi:dTDP-4-dehydrorhamnose 3,5-epimerase-like enzyme